MTKTEYEYWKYLYEKMDKAAAAWAIAKHAPRTKGVLAEIDGSDDNSYFVKLYFPKKDCIAVKVPIQEMLVSE